jgi:anti-sigma regulatory factor (Ser/Thr protein kinase)
VIRAALSEVEDYRRVVLRRVDDALINGPVVTEVAHMLAELIENGLMFSPPDVEVEIYGRRTGDRYLLVVVDYGVGMSPADLAKARARLRDEENFLVAPTRFLGHYVVGRLAKQLKIAVELGDSPVTGITARMLLPAELLIKPPAGVTSSPAPAQPVPAQNRGPRPALGPRRDGSATSTNNGDRTNWERTNGERTNGDRTNGERPNRERTNGERPAPRQPSRPVLPSRQLPAPVTSSPAAAVPSRSAPPAPGRTGSHAAPVERTRNGLVKRQVSGGDSATRPPVGPREPRLGRSASGGGPTGPNGPGSGQHHERTANEVGGMLSAFSRGHQRGEAQGPGSEQGNRGQTGSTNGRPSPLVQEEDSR